MNHELPEFNIEIENEDKKDFYRKFFADMRLNRLYFHMSLLKFFTGEKNKNQILSLLQSNIVFLNKMDFWINKLKTNGDFEDFKKICNEEILAMESIIKIYEERMKKGN